MPCCLFSSCVFSVESMGEDGIVSHQPWSSRMLGTGSLTDTCMLSLISVEVSLG